ncbi:hypothetical protein BDV25DRAFT_59273 [Aspergillus avenaceus]|uniref:Uncharacterized protein n=1 Tax=Aspergillus avenaceus TaxID=36643 RepID=A0A5N6TI56_ASPAV|nr:hypothetical protein BDV25DRAFT_59273 [Aspergillus avenaceus]
MPLFRRLKSRLSSSRPAKHSRPVDSKTTESADGEFAASHRSHKSHIPNGAQPEKVIQAPLEPVFNPSSQEPPHYWQNIDRPADTTRPHDQSFFGFHPLPGRSRSRLVMRPRSNMNSTLPGYNAVSGAVIVDWNGFPYFLSPEEEHERKLKLERAVQERMMGLSKQTDFAWSRPSHGTTLPRYSSKRDTLSPRPSFNKRQYQ